jgi:two-component system, cell cycle sensor histidine kinase and response regulator CckA
VVDDEELISTLACAVLEASGYRVLTALSAQAATALMRENAGNISLILLDAGMMSAFTALDPSALIIISSGSLPEDVLEYCDRMRISGFLQKPWNVSQLRDAVRLAFQTRRRAA